MAIASIILGVAALFFMMGGIMTTVVPVVGTLLSFGAPILALGGIVTGGVAISRSRQMGEPTGMGVAGVVTSAVALVPAVVVAFTCGLCNAMCSAGMMSQWDAQTPWWMKDGGSRGAPTQGPGPTPGPPDAGRPKGPLAPPPPGRWAHPDDGGAPTQGSAPAGQDPTDDGGPTAGP